MVTLPRQTTTGAEQSTRVALVTGLVGIAGQCAEACQRLHADDIRIRVLEKDDVTHSASDYRLKLLGDHQRRCAARRRYKLKPVQRKRSRYKVTNRSDLT